MPDARDAFMARVQQQDGGCWIWTGPRSGNDGQFHHGGRTVAARRFAYSRFVGPLDGRRFVLVTCREQLCVNPEHLFLSTPEDRFWRYVSKGDGCWEWTGRLGAYGYAVMAIDKTGKTMPAHRFSYELHHGPIPEGLFVCHHCDNRKCVRPDHLYAGTVVDNARDAVERDRLAKGEGHPHAALVEEQVVAIRSRYDAGEGVVALARAFGVSHSTIVRVGKRRGWRHVP